MRYKLKKGISAGVVLFFFPFTVITLGFLLLKFSLILFNFYFLA